MCLVEYTVVGYDKMPSFCDMGLAVVRFNVSGDVPGLQTQRKLGRWWTVEVDKPSVWEDGSSSHLIGHW